MEQMEILLPEDQQLQFNENDKLQYDDKDMQQISFDDDNDMQQISFDDNDMQQISFDDKVQLQFGRQKRLITKFEDDEPNFTLSQILSDDFTKKEIQQDPQGWNLPAIDDRANFDTNLASWQGLQYLRLSDIDIDNKIPHLSQKHPQFLQYMKTMLDLHIQFVQADSMESRMSTVLLWHQTLTGFLEFLETRIGAIKISPLEKPLRLLTLMHTVHRCPEFLEKLTQFEAAIALIASGQAEQEVKWHEIVFPKASNLDGRFVNGDDNAKFLKEKKENPEFDLEGAKFVAKEENHAQLVFLTVQLEVEVPLSDIRSLSKDIKNILANFRNRMVKDLVVQGVSIQSIKEACDAENWMLELRKHSAGLQGIPNEIIAAAFKHDNVEAELDFLKTSRTAIREVFTPVFQATQNHNKKWGLQALQKFVWFLVNPVKPSKHVEEFMSLLFVDMKSRKNLMRQTYVHGNKKAVEQAGRVKKTLLKMFVRLALNLTKIDGGRFLAGLIQSIWIAQKKSLKNIQKMDSRRLYKQGYSSTKPWRKWISEDLLMRFKDPNAKQIVKALVTQVTGKQYVQKSKDDVKVKASELASNLLDHFMN
jgi:hypothetical protein